MKNVSAYYGGLPSPYPVILENVKKELERCVVGVPCKNMCVVASALSIVKSQLEDLVLENGIRPAENFYRTDAIRDFARKHVGQVVKFAEVSRALSEEYGFASHSVSASMYAFGSDYKDSPKSSVLKVFKKVGYGKYLVLPEDKWLDKEK